MPGGIVVVRPDGEFDVGAAGLLPGYEAEGVRLLEPLAPPAVSEADLVAVGIDRQGRIVATGFGLTPGVDVFTMRLATSPS